VSKLSHFEGWHGVLNFKNDGRAGGRVGLSQEQRLPQSIKRSHQHPFVCVYWWLGTRIIFCHQHLLGMQHTRSGQDRGSSFRSQHGTRPTWSSWYDPRSDLLKIVKGISERPSEGFPFLSAVASSVCARRGLQLLTNALKIGLRLIGNMIFLDSLRDKDYCA